MTDYCLTKFGIKPQIQLRSHQVRRLGTGAALLGTFLSTLALSLPVAAVDFGNGQTFFDKSPLLIRSATGFRNPYVESSYYFTIQLPGQAGEALQAVTIIQQPNLEQIVLYPDRTRAFLGDDANSGAPVTITSASRTPQGNGIKVIFAEPVQPGQTVTVALRGRNPLYGGIYQFDITVYSAGQDSPGLSLGNGRIQFTVPSAF